MGTMVQLFTVTGAWPSLKIEKKMFTYEIKKNIFYVFNSKSIIK